MTLSMTLVSRRAPTMRDVRSAVAEAPELAGLGAADLVGDFDAGDLVVELNVEVGTGKRQLLQMFRPTVSLTTAADPYTVAIGLAPPLGEDGHCRLTQMAMSGLLSDEQVAAALGVVRQLALACAGYLVGEGQYAPLDGVPEPKRSDRPPPKRVPPPARAFVEAFLTRPIRGEPGWRESMNLLRDVLDGLPRLRPRFIQLDGEWRPFLPTDPVPPWWPLSQYLRTADPHVRWEITPAAFPGNYYTQVSLAGDLDPAEAERFLPTLIELARQDLDYGLVHAWHDDEPTGLPRGGLQRGKDGPWMLLTARNLTEHLPTLYWAQVFGPPWVELFGAPTLATTPAYRVEEVAPGHWLVQLTEHLADVVDDHARFDAARAAARQHLGADAFFDPERGWRGPYRAPTIPALADRGLGGS